MAELSMFDRLRRLVSELTGEVSGGGGGFARTDPEVALAALLVHLIGADGTVEPEERRALHALLKARFGLSDDETDTLIEEATLRDREAVDLYGFTSVLKRSLDDEGRQRAVEMMWELVYSDGAVHELEDNLVWRVAELLGIEQRERIALKQRVAKRHRPLGRENGAN